MIEHRESENAIRLKAMREAAEVGIVDIAAGRFRTFDTADSPRIYLWAIVTEALADPARCSRISRRPSRTSVAMSRLVTIDFQK